MIEQKKLSLMDSAHTSDFIVKLSFSLPAVIFLLWIGALRVNSQKCEKWNPCVWSL